jgi:putative tricarboxylic transport membrane protein
MAGKVMAVLFLILSLSYLFFARDLSFGTLGAPKAGFLATLAGMMATGLSLIIAFKEMLAREEAEAERTDLRKVIFVTIGLLYYLVILGVVGYLAATFMIMLYLLKVTDTVGWSVPLCLSAGISLGCYLLFKQYLGIFLP